MKTNKENIGKEIYLIFGHDDKESSNKYVFFSRKARIIDVKENECYIVYSSDINDIISSEDERIVELYASALNCKNFYANNNYIRGYRYWLSVKKYYKTDTYLYGFAFTSIKADRIINDLTNTLSRLIATHNLHYKETITLKAMSNKDLKNYKDANDLLSKCFEELKKINSVALDDIPYKEEYFTKSKVNSLNKLIKLAKDYIVKSNDKGDDVFEYSIELSFKARTNDSFKFVKSKEKLFFNRLTDLKKENFLPKTFTKDGITFTTYNKVYDMDIHIYIEGGYYRLVSFLKHYSIFKLGD